MKFIFVIGVEGAGHDMLRALLQEVIKQPYFVLAGNWHKILPNYWSPEARYRSEFGFLSKMSRQKVKYDLQNIIKNYTEEKMTHLMEDISFPFNQPRNSVCRPDILDFIDLTSDLVDIKFLVLYRNPVSSTYSSIRRGFTKNVFEQARIVEDNLIYIDKSLSVWDQNLYRTLVFEDFLKDPHAYLKGLADWLGLDYALLAQGVQNLQEPYAVDAIPKKISIVLTDFFSENRIRMWESLYSADHQIPKSK